MFDMDLSEFKELLSKLYKLNEDQVWEWICWWSTTCHQYTNGTCIKGEAEKMEFGCYEEWLEKDAPPNRSYDCSLDDILCDAANRGMIPEGTHLIHYSW